MAGQGPPYQNPYGVPPGGPGTFRPPPPYGAPAPYPPPRLPVPPRVPPPVPPGYGWRPPRRKKSNAGLIALGILGGLAAVLVLLIVFGALLSGGDDPTDTTSPVARPTYSYSLPPRPTSLSTPGPRPTFTQPQEPSRPPLNTSLDRNTVYSATALPKVSCPAGSANIHNHGSLKALIERTSRCMDKAWQPVLQNAGIRWHSPSWVIASGGGRGACGDFPPPGSGVPYYCPRNTTIYASTSAMAKGYGRVTSYHGAIIGMMGHEYGHHVQHLTGIWSASWAAQQQAGRDAKLALSRRAELQANCFGGMFMRSVSASYPLNSGARSTVFHFFSQVGDWPGRPRDHGSPPNSGRWFRTGFDKNKPAACNTWVASASSTS